ncbi:tRNA (guanosine(46)-N7)-methyltransferase TrmB [Minwuia sp.]|uniref:tRNA (guanosine(46)-N7)-methyltransferase TrmB n=1 Tax=Minwuia sp. TaxID=2493630 RepID=UPI003A8E0012
MSASKGPPFRFYGRRQGKKQSRRQNDLLAELLPRLTPDPDHLPDGDIWLEIGCGGGEHIVSQAAANPDVTLLGCEPFLEGVAKTLTEIEERDLHNVLLHGDDARPLLEAMPEACIARTFILFPDPWPKTRHNKRRFINPENLDRLARVIRPGAGLRIGTDHMDYARWILRHLLDHPAFEWTAERADDWRQSPADHFETRYERKARDKGDRPVFFEFVRRA